MNKTTWFDRTCLWNRGRFRGRWGFILTPGLENYYLYIWQNLVCTSIFIFWIALIQSKSITQWLMGFKIFIILVQFSLVTVSFYFLFFWSPFTKILTSRYEALAPRPGFIAPYLGGVLVVGKQNIILIFGWFIQW